MPVETEVQNSVCKFCGKEIYKMPNAKIWFHVEKNKMMCNISAPVATPGEEVEDGTITVLGLPEPSGNDLEVFI